MQVYKVLWLQPKHGVGEYATGTSWISQPLCPMLVNQTEGRRKTKRKKPDEQVQELWWSHVEPEAVYTSCTAKFILPKKQIKDISKMNFRFPNEEMGMFFLEAIANIDTGVALTALRPEAEEDDENRPDLDDDEEADDEEEEWFS